MPRRLEIKDPVRQPVPHPALAVSRVVLNRWFFTKPVLQSLCVSEGA
jgi:hypothetical protein